MPSEPEALNTMFHDSFIKVADGEFALRTQTATGGASTVVAFSQAGTNNAVQSLLPSAARTNSITAAGKVTAPGAGVAIATTASLAVGTWDIDITTFIGGTTAALEIDNARFLVGAGAFATLINPVPGAAGATANAKHSFRVQVATAGTVSVVANAAATAGAVYAANISATRTM